MSRSTIKRVAADPAAPTAPVVVKRKETRDLTVNAIGLIRTDDGWVACTFKVPLSQAVKVSEPDVRLVGIENFRRDAAAILVGEQ